MKRSFFVYALTLVIGVAFVLVGGTNVNAGPIKLTYSNFFPPTHIQSK
ncbi:MAG: C4-dicarboxylate ABC transporter substrate-binding protein, partial [Deltaproteobacteria bacterium]